jgi:hypothetical protein
VIESGWSESLQRLRDDVNLWLVGGNGAVKATIILIWEQVPNTLQVKGVAELYALDMNGVPVLRQTETIFPTPPQGQSQVFNPTRGMILGSYMDPGKSSNDPFPMKLDILRGRAGDALIRMGLVPA